MLFTEFNEREFSDDFTEEEKEIIEQYEIYKGLSYKEEFDILGEEILSELLESYDIYKEKLESRPFAVNEDVRRAFFEKDEEIKNSILTKCDVLSSIRKEIAENKTEENRTPEELDERFEVCSKIRKAIKEAILNSENYLLFSFIDRKTVPAFFVKAKGRDVLRGVDYVICIGEYGYQYLVGNNVDFKTDRGLIMLYLK